MKKYYYQAKEFFDKYERYLMPATMAVGFVVDNLTLQRIDLWLENIIILAYLTLAASAIIYINTYKKKRYEQRFLAWLSLVAPYIMQYAFGALFSAFIVFYVRSSTFVVSWPFLLLLFALLLGNEFFRNKYERLYFHLSVLYLAIFAYSVFAVPVVLSQIGPWIFILSGAISLVVIAGLIYLLYRIDTSTLKENRKRLLWSIGGIFIIFNLLYFLNIIPPIPLAMKEGGVYHSVRRVGADYKMTYEDPAWYRPWRETAKTFHWQPGQRVYAWSVIFAPTDFSERVYHRWLWYNEIEGEWVERDLLSYSIVGGREGGYRGYSYKTSLEPGDWRVDVLTDTNQVLGRIRFEIAETLEEVELEEK